MKGKVIIIGAGPGDPDLLTIRAFRILQKADVILTDRLVAPEILSRYVSPKAEIVYVGKQGSKDNSTPQASINELMVIYAGEGKLVARLKGGDVSIFSNVLDELDTLVKHQVPFEIVPGITAALGAAAYSGIPLTARNHANAVRFLTIYKPGVVSTAQWKELASTEDTLVFYMSSAKLDDTIKRLLAHNIDKEKQVAVIEQATTVFQKVYTSKLRDYHKQLKGKEFLSPSLVIIGKVVALHEQFKWFSEDFSTEEYFRPIEQCNLETLSLIA
jgi:uroporphyrin-III C-methyltransferase